jgi:hypothetical protein
VFPLNTLRSLLHIQPNKIISKTMPLCSPARLAAPLQTAPVLPKHFHLQL